MWKLEKMWVEYRARASPQKGELTSPDRLFRGCGRLGAFRTMLGLIKKHLGDLKIFFYIPQAPHNHHPKKKASAECG